MSRNTELYRKASEAIPGEDNRNFVLRQIRNGWCMGYEQAEKDTVDRAAEWWYDHIVGFMKEGLAKNVIEEFREAMAGREKEN